MALISEVQPGIWRGETDGFVFFAVLSDKANSLGLPANGGLRLLSYPHESEALPDGRALNKRMSWKHRLYGTGFSGMKMVANCDPQDFVQRKSLLYTISEFLNQFEGKAYTGCDLNTDSGDMEYLSSLTPDILSSLGTAIDSSRATGYGVVGGILGCVGAFGPLT